MGTDTSLDASVLINFLKIKRIDLLKSCNHSFHITDHVEKEIREHYPQQKELLEFGFEQRVFQRTNTTTLEELATFAQLHKERLLGAGECAAIAIAHHRQYCLAIDDKQAIKKAAHLIPLQSILRTENLLLEMIQNQILSKEDAFLLLEIWAKEHRFKLNPACLLENRFLDLQNR